LGIKEGKLNAYLYDGVLLPSDVFEKFILKEKYKQHIIDQKEDD
jgi:hypothetical protein